MKINNYSEAVRDAKYTVAMRPDWGKGYFRFGRALSGLGDPEEALLAFFHCLVLEETCSKALRAEIVRVSFFFPTGIISTYHDLWALVGAEQDLVKGSEQNGAGYN